MSSFRYHDLKMDKESFEKLSNFITRHYGIKLPPEKKTMLECRLNKKVSGLGFSTYKDFTDYIFSEKGKESELYHVVDLITTNKTDFFREAAHFDFLSDRFLPAYITRFKRNNLKIWSAGCSTGEEPYTLMMVMEEFKRKYPDVSYSILASDISLSVIQAAYSGIYKAEKIQAIPPDRKRNFFLQSKTNPFIFRIKPQYRKKISYKRINLIGKNYGLQKGEMDVIFCRNVLIYFNKDKQFEVIEKFCGLLKPGGLLVLGHSESVMGMNLPLTQLSPTIYEKK